MMFYISGWLDDIGLPQYKDTFFDARVDGRMLNSLTVVCDFLHTHKNRIFSDSKFEIIFTN